MTKIILDIYFNIIISAVEYKYRIEEIEKYTFNFYYIIILIFLNIIIYIFFNSEDLNSEMIKLSLKENKINFMILLFL